MFDLIGSNRSRVKSYHIFNQNFFGHCQFYFFFPRGHLVDREWYNKTTFSFIKSVTSLANIGRGQIFKLKPGYINYWCYLRSLLNYKICIYSSKQYYVSKVVCKLGNLYSNFEHIPIEFIVFEKNKRKSSQLLINNDKGLVQVKSKSVGVVGTSNRVYN